MSFKRSQTLTYPCAHNNLLQSFKKRALLLHPDKNPNGEAAFKQLNKAYATLTNTQVTPNHNHDQNKGKAEPSIGLMQVAIRLYYIKVARTKGAQWPSVVFLGVP